ncbi:MAG: hypothetical protein AAB653_00035 [Patescibacteria group bacterium]
MKVTRLFEERKANFFKGEMVLLRIEEYYCRLTIDRIEKCSKCFEGLCSCDSSFSKCPCKGFLLGFKEAKQEPPFCPVTKEGRLFVRPVFHKI